MSADNEAKLTVDVQTAEGGWVNEEIRTREGVIYDGVLKFFNDNPENMKVLIDILVHKTISIRILDWFVCNYSKQHGTFYEFEGQARGELSPHETVRVKVHADYRTFLETFKKKIFDPFCRRKRIMLSVDDENNMETTLAQLNHFKWMIEKRVIPYVKDHLDEIKEDIELRGNNKTTSATKRKRSETEVQATNKTRKKREELSTQEKGLSVEIVKVVNKFPIY